MISILIKASIVITILLAFYKIILERESFFAANRYYLLACLALAFMLPFITLPKLMEGQGYISKLIDQPQLTTSPSPQKQPKTIEKTVDQNKKMTTVPNQTSIKETNTTNNEKLTENMVSQKESKSRGLTYWMMMIYFFGVGILLLNLLAQVTAILYKAIKNEDKIEDEGFIIVNMTGKIEPCSFFKYIFINPATYDYETYEQIIAHEKIHVQKRHTIDLLLSELAVIVLWFNPFIWLFRKEVEKNIEYQTDDYMVNAGTVKKQDYQLSLLKIATYQRPLTVTTNYNQSLIKQRIMKMTTKKSNPYSYWKYAFIAPILLMTLLVLNKPIEVIAGTSTKEIILSENEFTKIHKTTPDKKSEDEKIAKKLEKTPTKPKTTTASKESINYGKDCKALLQAIRNEDIVAVKNLLKTVDVNCINRNHEYQDVHIHGSYIRQREPLTALVTAALTGNVEICKLLLANNADIDLHADHDPTPLMAAAEIGNMELVKMFLAKGADVNHDVDHRGTPLMSAAESGDLEIAKLLIAEGAKLDTRVAHFGTPLIIAARQGHTDMIDLLLSKGAAIDRSVAHVGTPLILAARGGQTEAVRLLISKGADLDKGVAHVGTPLILASRKGEMEIVKLLISKGADLDKGVAHVGTPLILAARDGEKDMTELLISKGANLDRGIAHVGTPLILASRNGEEEIVDLLISNGANLNQEVAHVGTPLILAAREGDEATVKMLIAKGANLDRGVAHVGTPLILAARNGQDNIVKLLLDNGAAIDKAVAHVGTPLMLATREGNARIVTTLLEKGANVNKVVEHVGTALNKAVRGGNLKLAKLLLDNGAEPHLRANHCDSPMEDARQSNSEAMLKLLGSY